MAVVAIDMTPGSIAAVITCRDLGSTLLEALDSVERQTRPAAEIVVIDDASIDLYTRHLLARLERDGTRVAHGEGRGASAARNLGARLTSAEYVVCLDADDVLEAGYFEAAAARLDLDPGLDFVSCALRAFGDAHYVWRPSPPTFVDAISTGGVPHASTMLRRQLWDTIGGFDEDVPSFELLDFWASVIERGFRGVILDEPLLNYRVRPGSAYRRSIQPETYLARLQHFYGKHRAAVERHGLALIAAKEAFLISQRDWWQTLESQAAALEAELAGLDAEIARTARLLESHGVSRVDWGDFAQVQPLGRTLGRDRATAIDRYYVERFLDTCRADVRGRVLEIREPVIADLQRAGSIPADSYDCVILTETLHAIDDMAAVVAECARILRPEGVLLATFPSASGVNDGAGPRGDSWRLTEASARTLFAGVFPLDAFDVTAYGNVKSCAAFLHGISAEEIVRADLDRVDARFPLLIAIRAVKTRPAVAPAFRSLTSAPHQAVILAYHRVADLSPDSHALCTPPEVFREHMAYVRDHCSPIGLDDLVRAAASGRIPRDAVAITFDDGYLDALTVASPILSALGLPATFFVNSDRLNEEHERWWDVLERIMSSGVTLPSTLELSARGRDVRVPTTTARERADALRFLNEIAWPLDADERERLVQDVLIWSGMECRPRTTHRVLTADEIRMLAARPGHSVGAHTTHHLALTTQPADTKRTEVFENKATLGLVIQRPVHLFSYPYGDLDPALIGIVSEARFRAAVTVRPGLVSAGTNRLLLPRYEITPQRHRDFAHWIREMFEAADAQFTTGTV